MASSPRLGTAALRLGRRRHAGRRHLLVAARAGAVVGRHPRDSACTAYTAGTASGAAGRCPTPSPPWPNAPAALASSSRCAAASPSSTRRPARCADSTNPSPSAPATASTTASATRRAASGPARWTSPAAPRPARCTGSTPTGRCTRVLDAGFAVTNGPTWSLDGRTMFFNDTVAPHRARVRLRPGARHARRARVFLRFEKADGFPDGMTTDAAGRLWIAHWGAACVSCHDPASGAELARIAPADRPHHQRRVRRPGPDDAVHHQRALRA